MKIASAIVGALIASVLLGSVLGVVVGAFVDTQTAAGKSQSSNILGIAFFVSWAGLAFLFSHADSARHAWARAFLWMGLAVLTAPLATIVFTVAFASRQSSALAGAGAGLGGVIATLAVSFVAFFFAAVLLVIAYALSRGGTKRREPTRRCPHCAEEILAAAAVCRFCGRDVAASATAPA